MARLAVKTQRFRDLDFSDRVPVRSRITEVLRLSEAVERMREGLEVFGHYVSKDLVRQIMRSPASTGVGGERRDVTVMFTDIEGFSRISEDIEPELLTSRLSRYFEALGAAIATRRCGFVWRALELLEDVEPEANLERRKQALARAGEWLGALPPRLALEQEDALAAVAERCGYSVEAVQRRFRTRYWRAGAEPAMTRAREAAREL